MASSLPPRPRAHAVGRDRAWRWRATLAVALSALVGCGGPAWPPRFASTLIGGAELPSPPAAAGDERAAAAPGAARTTSRSGPRVPDLAAAAPRELPATLPGWPQPLPGDGPRQALLAMVGTRDKADPARAVLALCRTRGHRCPELSAEQDLESLSVVPLEPDLPPGAVLLFGHVGLDNQDRMLALVTDRDPRGVLEIFYLAAGVWRRGFLDPARPHLPRDAQGRVVNTYLRHHRARPPAGTRFLAGELLLGRVSSVAASR